MTNTVSRTVTDEVLNCIIQIESAGNPNAKAGTSSATGLGQFLKATWLGTVRKHRPDLFARATEAQILALRTNPSSAIEMLARFTEDNQRVVGRDCTPGDLYLAHFLGAGTAQKVYKANPNSPVEPIVGEAAVKANESILRNKTAGQVRSWAASKMAKHGGKQWIAKYYKGPMIAMPTKLVDQEEVPINVQPQRAVINLHLKAMQEKLIRLNYHEVGDPDGRWGGKTRGAIIAFLNDRGKDIDGKTDQKGFTSEEAGELVSNEIELALSEGWSRPIAPKRAEATVNEIAEKNEIVSLTLWQRFTSKIGMWFTGLGLGSSSIFGIYEYVEDKVTGVRETFKSIPPEVWFLIIGILVGVIYYTTRKTLQVAKENYNKGKIN